ncbi:ATP-binding protein [Paraburkholderia sp. Ac-20347]|uniref:ATP-binding protein n=1 Tax=Paraburkholderia sp. Ac-20347 TaxID=2703892 RepID=UPI00197E72F6|nr:ATP-binding protein [Paraburkholderia sp. Ac-20347]MBN3810704.1 histidine kinase [Paraburkholderia sp. Ac-20347]
MNTPLLRIRLEAAQDVVAARRRARELAAGFGFSPLDQTRIASAVSEIARNAVEYAGGGEALFAFDSACMPQAFEIVVRDRGQGVREIESVLDGTYRSPGGMGLGIVGSRRLMDRFEIDSTPRGTTVTMARYLPAERPALRGAELERIVRGVSAGEPQALQSDSLEEMRQQNRELVATLDELRERQDELARLTQELEATNRGVVALYAELDERAEELRRADMMKTRFLSNMSHELRTPLSSIRALATLLLNRLDGDLSEEQDRQVKLILSSAETLGETVDDLLDLAKIEAGKTVVSPAWFDPADLFGALRTMLMPLLTTPLVSLEFASTAQLPRLYTDEPKLTQILRNFVSNALKYTERGQIRVGGQLEADGERVTFFVADTGIGIAPEHHQIVFEEFGQVENRLQQRVKGTGLGLPLCRKLAALLGGEVGVESEPGVGSTFYVSVPVQLDTGEAAHDGAQHTPSDAQSEAPNEAPAERATSGDGAS